MKYLNYLLLAVMLFAGTETIAAIPAESLGRALAVTEMTNGGVYLSWRLFDSDPADIAFDVYRVSGSKRTKLNENPITATTDLSAAVSAKRASFELVAISGGKTLDTSNALATCKAEGKNAAVRTIKLGSVSGERVGFGDLDGDGNLDYVVKQPGDFGIDPYYKSWKKSRNPYFLEAYSHDGTVMWRYEMGWSIETGTWYSPYAIFDLDGDGCAEVAVKASDGDYRNEEGHVWTGPEYLDILDGKTGKRIARTDWISREPWVDAMGPEWGYEYSSREQIMVACLDGEKPSVVIQRGTYDINILWAFDYADGELVKRWSWDNRGETKDYYAQSSHTINPADVDGDGKDELIIGSVCLDDNGNSLWSTGQEHPDANYVSDFDPDRPGLEIYYGLEMRQNKNGMCLADARTGEIIWGIDVPTKHVHSYGLAGDIDGSRRGSEFYGRDRETPGGAWLKDCKGNDISEAPFSAQIVHTVYWDDDPQRELIHGGITNLGEKEPIAKYKGRVLAIADICGDWREEIITTSEEDGKLMIYSTTIPAKDRRAHLMSDPIYRLNMIGFSSGYWHNPMLSYDMASQGE